MQRRRGSIAIILEMRSRLTRIHVERRVLCVHLTAFRDIATSLCIRSSQYVPQSSSRVRSRICRSSLMDGSHLKA